VQTLSDVILLRSWSNQTIDGDISTCVSVAEDSQAWPLVTSTNDNCLGSDCPLYKDCFVVKARKKAMDADVVVVNHHLFLADMVVKESGFAELIPEAEVMIFDEAHQLPDIASQYFGQSLSSRQLLDLAKDITIAYRTELKDTQQLQKCADRLAQSAQDFRLQLGEPGYRGNLRDCWRTATFSGRCCCSMMRWSCAMTWQNCLWDVRRCWMPPLNARRSIVRGSSD
jgi:ATP-dependent DNA helicase DinG